MLYSYNSDRGNSDSHSEITYPSLVDSLGRHISYGVHLASTYQSKANQPNLVHFNSRTYFKVEAFGKRYLLNVSSSSHFLHSTPENPPTVEYIRANGVSRTKVMNHSKLCFHTGHVQLMGEDSEEETSTDGWVAMSSCSGLVSKTEHTVFICLCAVHMHTCAVLCVSYAGVCN